ncbi:MAG: sigma-70 family RNA polymerase sigma factor, partial [Chloroflexi bacterium]
MPIAADPQRDMQRVSKLVIRAKQGDTNAIGELYECHRLGIFRYLYYRTGDIQVADDLTSEVFLRMIRSLSGYRQQNVAFQAWLFQIAHNLLNDHYRKMSVRNHVQLEENIMDNPPSPPSRPVEHSLNDVTLQNALEQLSDEQRDVIVMRFITGMPISDVAQALHKSEDAIKGLQRRALANLRDVLVDWEVN